MLVNRYLGNPHKPENIGSTIAWVAFLLLAGMLAFNVVLPNNDINIGIGVLIVCTATMVLGFYVAPSVRAVVSGSAENTDYLIVGIALSWLATDLREVLVIIGRLADMSPRFFNSEIWAPIKLLYPIAAVLHVLPKGAADGVIPRTNKAILWGTFVVAAVLAVAVLTYRPSTAGIIERMPGWMRDFWGTEQVARTRPPGAPPS